MTIEAFYINLDRSVERRERMEERISAHFDGLSCARFSAFEGDNRPSAISKAELGCFLSHRKVIENGAAAAFTCVLEDDVIFPAGFGRRLRALLDQPGSVTPEWDILFLAQMVDVANAPALYRLLNLKQQLRPKGGAPQRFTFLDCRGVYVSGMSSYVVNPRSRALIVDLLQEAEARGFPEPVDIFLMRQINCNALRARFLFPYLTGVDCQQDSAVQEGEKLARSVLLEDLLNLLSVTADKASLMARYQPTRKLVADETEKFLASQILFRRLIL